MEKILDNMKPYNKFFLISCFNQERVAVYEHYGVDDKFFVANNFLVHKYDRRKRICSSVWPGIGTVTVVTPIMR